LGIQISPTAFQGDADDTKSLVWGEDWKKNNKKRLLGIAYGGHLKYSVSQSFALKLNANFGTLTGGRANQNISRNGRTQYNQKDKPVNVNDPGNQAPSEDDYIFVNHFKEVNICMVYTLGNISFLRPLRKFQMFVFFGFGGIWSDVEGNWPKGMAPSYAVNYAKENDPVLKYEGRNFAIPFGIGIKRNFGKWLDLGFEFRENYTRSDNIDAFSYPEWRNRFTDFYTILGFQASFKLGTKGRDDHYDWLNPIESIYEAMDSISISQEKIDQLAVDSDGDGVADYFDKEPESQNNVIVYGSGVSVDSDQDGIIDVNDKEPFSEKGAPIDVNGIMIDIDKDAIPDYRDEDPTTEAGLAVTPTGRAVRSGGSGGSCCNCEDVVLPSVIFDEGSTRIKPEFYGTLYTIAEKMKECPDLKIVTEGYSMKSKAGEQLSWKRSNTIIEFLNKEYGVSRDRFIIDYNNQAEPGKDYNGRRIDIRKAGMNENGTSNPPAPFPGSR
jgi:outer membrane protein OmpA-like peptidoglycan-associated protein